MLRFVDISNNNRDLVLSYLVGQIDALALKATEGVGWVDKSCDKWYQEAKRYGLLRAFYHFARNNDPITEADFFRQSTLGYEGDAIPLLDAETGQSTDWVNRFVERYHELTKVWTWIYASEGDAPFSWRDVNSNCGRWVAKWPGSSVRTFDAAASSNKKPNPGGLVAAWQFTNCGKLSGYSGNLDMDVFYGDKVAWEKYARGERDSNVSDGNTPAPAADVQVLENDSYKVTVERKD